MKVTWTKIITNKLVSFLVFLISHPAEFAVSHLKGGDQHARQTSSEVSLCESESLPLDTTLDFALVPALFVIKIIRYVHLDKRTDQFFQFWQSQKRNNIEI